MKVATSTLVASSFLVASASSALAVPAPAPSTQKRQEAVVHVPLTKREVQKRSGSDLLEWANAQKAHLQGKYHMNSASSSSSSSSQRKRQSGQSLINLQYDSTWLATVSGGTPAQDYNVVLDTGSSDFWIDSAYSPSSSSSFRNVSTAFDIQYGSGAVDGYQATDDFTLAGTTVQNLGFAVATSVSSGLVDSNMDGIMGMGFQRLASSGDKPFWIAANADTFSFYLQRASFTSSNQLQYGGVFTLGGSNSSLYQGDINYNSVIEALYWMIDLGGISAGGSSVSLNSLDRAAIDTGTTLIGGPDSVVQSIYANIAGSQSQGNGYYSYPCSSTINATMTFGNKQYTISDTDFSAGTLDSRGSTCLGAFFGLGSTLQTDLQWIVGDAFLKNVYTVFTNADNNPRVGFASLANGLNSGTNSRTVSTSSSGSGSSSPASKSSSLSSTSLATLAIGATAAIFASVL
ncbi:acid protease [Testicularia cyperi]|uniref:Acid protease n=1 Tax=Testicularia cyperi TaxID=1882483 RepID=A0A317XIK5_9BASI|nr:acid protease [Testicularia cyperi]